MLCVNDEPEGKFLYTGTIKLYCVVCGYTRYLLTQHLVNLRVADERTLTNSKQTLANFERSETEDCGCVLVGWGSR